LTYDQQVKAAAVAAAAAVQLLERGRFGRVRVPRFLEAGGKGCFYVGMYSK
jgi:hypothetical protein